MHTRAPCRKNYFKSRRHLSKWSSPEATITCSPVSWINTSTLGSDWLRIRRPSTSLGISTGLVASTATLTMGEDAKLIEEKVVHRGVVETWIIEKKRRS